MKWLNDCRFRMTFVGFVAAVVLGGTNAKADFTFGEPTNLGPTVNSEALEYSHSVSVDGLELYFGSEREGGFGNIDIWVSTRDSIDDEWGPPENMGAIVNSSNAEMGVSLSTDGIELYFQSWRSNGSGCEDIWVTKRSARGGPWGEPINLGPTVNSEVDEYNPCLSADGLELYFVFGEWDPQDEPAHLSLGMTKRDTKDDPWGESVNLGPVVNDWSYQDTPWISSDSRLLMFTDIWKFEPRPDGFGGTDIWFTARANSGGDWVTPMNLGAPVNTAFDEDFPMTSADGSVIYFNSNRPGGSGSHDLWQASILPVVDFDDDGSVGTSDLTLMIESWGTDDPLCDIGPMPWGDGVVDEADLDVLMDYWGQEVEYLYDPRFASNPEPSDGSTSAVVHLCWIPARGAVQHDVYLGTYPVLVENADITDTSGIYRGRQDASEYTPLEELGSGQTYFWRVDEFEADGTISKGRLWSFTVADLPDSFVVDDFESYIVEGGMFDPGQIYFTWIDGYDDDQNGSQVGYANPPWVEPTIVHSGLQSMPFFYDNSNAPISRTFRQWEDPQDWTLRGPQLLKLWIYGQADNSVEPFYVILEDNAGNRETVTLTNFDPSTESWQQLSFPLSDFVGVDTKTVKRMYMGVGDRTIPGGLGKLFIDDIELHRPSGQ